MMETPVYKTIYFNGKSKLLFGLSSIIIAIILLPGSINLYFSGDIYDWFTLSVIILCFFTGLLELILGIYFLFFKSKVWAIVHDDEIVIKNRRYNLSAFDSIENTASHLRFNLLKKKIQVRKSFIENEDLYQLEAILIKKKVLTDIF